MNTTGEEGREPAALHTPVRGIDATTCGTSVPRTVCIAASSCANNRSARGK